MNIIPRELPDKMYVVVIFSITTTITKKRICENCLINYLGMLPSEYGYNKAETKAYKPCENCRKYTKDANQWLANKMKHR